MNGKISEALPTSILQNLYKVWRTKRTRTLMRSICVGILSRRLMKKASVTLVSPHIIPTKEPLNYTRAFMMTNF